MNTQNKSIKLFKISRLCLYLLLPLIGSTVFAQPESERDAVATTAKLFLQHQARTLGERVKIELNMPAIQLPTCENPEAFLARNSQIKPGRVSVGIQCGIERRTTRYMQAYISVMGRYVSVVETINPGSIVESFDIEEIVGDLSRLPNSAIRSSENAIGKISKLRLRPGTVLLQQHLTTPSVIERGESVTVESGGQGFSVSLKGEALESGSIGDKIRIRISRKKTLTATVTAQARVSL